MLEEDVSEAKGMETQRLPTTILIKWNFKTLLAGLVRAGDGRRMEGGLGAGNPPK